VGYDSETRTLEIEFVAGGVYLYFDVPEWVDQNLRSAESKGTYFREHIRDVYRFEVISKPERDGVPKRRKRREVPRSPRGYR